MRDGSRAHGLESNYLNGSLQHLSRIRLGATLASDVPSEYERASPEASLCSSWTLPYGFAHFFSLTVKNLTDLL